MKIIFYGRRNTGLNALIYLWGRHDKGEDEIKVISDDENILWLADEFYLDVVNFDTMGDYDWLFCVHGNKVIPDKYLIKNKCINFHPMLSKYKGHNPIKRYIENFDTVGSIGSHYMTSEVDEGAVIHEEVFHVGKCNDYANFYNIALPYYYKIIERTLEKLGI